MTININELTIDINSKFIRLVGDNSGYAWRLYYISVRGIINKHFRTSYVENALLSVLKDRQQVQEVLDLL